MRALLLGLAAAATALGGCSQYGDRYDVDPRYASIISGIPGHPVEDVTLSDIRIVYRGGLSPDHVARQPADMVNTFFFREGPEPRPPYETPERERDYPEPSMFGLIPAYGFFVRHAEGITFDNVRIGFETADTRPAVFLHDVRNVYLTGFRADIEPGADRFVLRDVENLHVRNSAPLPDTLLERIEEKVW